MANNNSAFAGHGDTNDENNEVKNNSEVAQAEESSGGVTEKEREIAKKFHMDMDNSSSNKKTDKKPKRPKEKGKGFMLFSGGLILISFLFLVWFTFSGSANRSANKVKQAQSERVSQTINSDPKLKKANEQKKQQATDKKKSKVKKNLDEYSVINNSDTLSMLKLHDAVVNATNNKNGQEFYNTVNSLQSEINTNSNKLVSLPQSGSYKDLYNTVKARNDLINKTLTREGSTQSISDIQRIYNKAAEKVNSYNQSYLTAFKGTLNDNKIKYSVDANGNFNY